MKRDLRILDDWLDEISIVGSAADRTDGFDPKEAGTKFRERTKSKIYIFTEISKFTEADTRALKYDEIQVFAKLLMLSRGKYNIK